jgi:HPr kinase/phosphorylase
MLTVHATCVAIAGEAVLLRGPSGAGKSDLALRLIDGIAGAGLVVDDRTILTRDGQRIVASAPDGIHGLLEIRGLGPVRVTAAAPTPVSLIVDLVPMADVPRLPDPAFETLCDVSLPRLSLHAFEASAPAKVKWALARAATGRLFEPDEAGDTGTVIRFRHQA